MKNKTRFYWWYDYRSNAILRSFNSGNTKDNPLRKRFLHIWFK